MAIQTQQYFSVQNKMKKNNTGFTIIEVSIAGLLMVVIGIAILGLQKLMSDSQLFALRSYTTVEDANSSVTQIAREMRTMRAGQNGSYAISYARDNDISFYSDIDHDGVSEQVRYYLDDTTLMKSTTEPSGFPPVYLSQNTQTRPIATNVGNGANPLFLYFNENWPEDTTNNPLPTPANLADISLIRIFLSIDNYTLGTNVNLRMLKENL